MPPSSGDDGLGLGLGAGQVGAGVGVVAPRSAPPAPRRSPVTVGNASAKPSTDGLPITSAVRPSAWRTWRRKRDEASWRTTAVRSDSGCRRRRRGRAGSSASISSHGRLAVCAVDDQHDALELARGVLEVVRHHQLEQHAAEVVAPDGAVDLLRAPAPRPAPAGAAAPPTRRARAGRRRGSAGGRRAACAARASGAAGGCGAAAQRVVALGRAVGVAAVGVGDDQARPVARCCGCRTAAGAAPSPRTSSPRDDQRRALRRCALGASCALRSRSA